MGETINFSIKENPTTGYTLFVVDAKQAGDPVFFYDSRYESYKSYMTKPLLGAGGTRIYSVTGNKSGQQ